MRAILLFLFIFTPFANAACMSVPISALYSDEYERCRENALNEYDMVRCRKREMQKADRELKIAFQEAKSKIQRFRRQDLKKVQRAWVNYRDAKCSFLYHRRSGSAGLGAASECMLNETIKRTIELKNIY